MNFCETVGLLIVYAGVPGASQWQETKQGDELALGRPYGSNVDLFVRTFDPFCITGGDVRAVYVSFVVVFDTSTLTVVDYAFLYTREREILNIRHAVNYRSAARPWGHRTGITVCTAYDVSSKSQSFMLILMVKCTKKMAPIL